jgi:Leucine-rich repeat (LRR) protein
MKGALRLLVVVLFAAWGSKVNAQLLDSASLLQEPVFDNLAEALREPEKVVRLHLVKQKITEFPKEIFQFPNLQELDLSRNRIKELPDSIGNLKNLQVLNLSRNQLEVLPSSIGKLINLRKLTVNQNSLTALPPAIGDLQNLRVLDLWSNDISFWPEQMADLKKLRYMDLRVILIDGEMQKKIQDMLPSTKIDFSPDCNCGG